MSQAPTVGSRVQRPVTDLDDDGSRAIRGRTPARPRSTVTVTSSNPSVATATAAPLQPGEQTITLTITTLQEGVDRTHDPRRHGSPHHHGRRRRRASPGLAAVIASPAGRARYLGRTVGGPDRVERGRTRRSPSRCWRLPHAGPAPLPVTVTSSNPTQSPRPWPRPSSRARSVTTLTITTLAEGFVTLHGPRRHLDPFGRRLRRNAAAVADTADVGAADRRQRRGLPFIGKAFAPPARPGDGRHPAPAERRPRRRR